MKNLLLGAAFLGLAFVSCQNMSKNTFEAGEGPMVCPATGGACEMDMDACEDMGACPDQAGCDMEGMKGMEGCDMDAAKMEGCDMEGMDAAAMECCSGKE